MGPPIGGLQHRASRRRDYSRPANREVLNICLRREFERRGRRQFVCPIGVTDMHIDVGYPRAGKIHRLRPDGYDLVAFHAGLNSQDVPQGAALLHMLGLAPHARDRCESLSTGMRQKVALAGALVPDPKPIILDEALTGLDAGGDQDYPHPGCRGTHGGTPPPDQRRRCQRGGCQFGGRVPESDRTADAGRVMQPAGIAWFAAHEARLAWRDWRLLVGSQGWGRTIGTIGACSA